MKSKFIFSVIALVVFSLVISCSKDNDTNENPINSSEKTKETPKTNSGGNDNSKQEGNDDQPTPKGDNNNSPKEGDNNNQPTPKGDNNDTPKEIPNSEKEVLFVQKVLVEDMTGSWCSNCPRVIRAIENAEKGALKDRFIPVAIHNNKRNYAKDPMVINEQISTEFHKKFAKLFGLSVPLGFPSAFINRNDQFFSLNGAQNSYAFLDENKTSPIGIKISSQLQNTGGTISVTFNFSTKYENLKYHVFITEDNFYSNQNGMGYISHNDILRTIYNSIDGNDLGSVEKNIPIEKNNLQVNYDLKTNDINNVNVVVFVTNQKGKVLNVQEAKANTTREFEYAN